MIKHVDRQLRNSYRKIQAKAQTVTFDLSDSSFWAKTRDRHDRVNQFLHMLTAPIIWAGIVPALLIDLFVTIYQHICFPVYRIKPVKRCDFIVFDREHLQFLSLTEKINCMYCSYFNGIAAYTREVAARTERYWCPLKHQSDPKSPHRLYRQFADYGDEKNFRRKPVNLKNHIHHCCE